MGQARTLTLQAVDARLYRRATPITLLYILQILQILSKNQFAIPESYPEGSSVSA